MSRELQQYIEDALRAGADKPTVEATLVGAGWMPDVVSKTLAQYAGLDAKGLLVPVPRLGIHHLFRDLFVYLLILITLTMGCFALGTLLFNLIDRWVPDPTVHDALHTISWAVAQLVVTAPTFFWLSVWLKRHVGQFPQKRESLIRKLMIYLLLFTAAMVTLGDLIAALTSFLEGELTTRFLCKALVVLGLSVSVFAYYLLEMRGDDRLVKAAHAA